MAYLGPSLKREKRTERPVRRVVIAALVSLALNAVLIETLVAAGAFSFKPPPEKTRVSMAPLSGSQWEANRAIAGARPPPAAMPRPPPPPQNDRMDGRVVELSPNQKASEKPPPSSRFLSDRNTQVDKETVSRHAGNYARVAPKPEPGSDGKAPQPQPAPKPPAKPDVQPGGKDAGAPGREGAPGDRVALARPGGALRTPEIGEGGQHGRRGGESGPDLSVSHEAMARIAGGGPTMDGVREGLPEGEETWLNAREFKYATFMNRMKSEIAQQWFPRVRDAQQSRDPDGRLYFYKERTVVLGLTIDTNGNVKDLSVLQSSNVEFFDRAAVSSVQAAQPFPNPPRGMFHDDQQVRIPFSFTMFPGDRHGLLFWRPPPGE